MLGSFVIRFLNAKEEPQLKFIANALVFIGGKLWTDRTWQNAVVNWTFIMKIGAGDRQSSDCLIQKTEEKVRSDMHVKIDELHEQSSEVWRPALYQTMTKILGYRKLCARWLPKISSEGHKKNRVAAALLFVARCGDQRDDFLKCILTRDETSVFHQTPETKRQSV